MAERPDEYELDDYPEKKQGEYDNRPTSYEEEKFFQENSLDRESYKSFRIRQQLIESNRVSRHTSFLDGRKKEIKILKKNILSEIFKVPYDEIDETKFDLKIEPVNIETFKLYNKKGIPLVEYNAKYDSLRVISEDDFKIFKLDYINKISMRYVEKEMKSDFLIKSDLSAIDLEVRQSESEEYHRNIDSLEREVSRLKQFENDSIEKSKRIEELEDELERTKVDADNKIETARDSLRLKSTQLVNAEIEISNLELNIKDLENKIFDLEHSIGFKDININSLHSQLNNAKEDLNRKKAYYESRLSDLDSDTKREKESLENNISSKKKEIEKLVKEKRDLESFQSSLEIKIVELENSIRIYELNLDVEKSISKSVQEKLDESKKEIESLKDDILRTEKVKELEIKAYRSEIDMREKWNERDDLEIKQKKQDIEKLEDKIRENNTEIGSLRFEKESLTERVEELNREIQQSENTNDVLTEQLDRVNTEILGLNERIQEIQTENQTFVTELDTLRSNFGNLVAATETTNNNNTQEILRLNNEIKRLESETDSIETYVNGLVESVDNYKSLLDDAYEDKKKLKKEFEEEFDKLNKEKESLVKDLKNKSKNEEDLMKKLWQNENNYSLLVQKYEKSFSTIYDLTLSLDKTSEREKILEGELEQRESRIKAKDDEVTEKMDEIKKLKKQIEDSNFNIKNSDFYEQQYIKTKIELDKTISERNKYIQDLNNSKGDNDELEQDIEVLEKEIEVLTKDRDLARSKIIPKETVDQMKHDNQELNKQLDVREKQLKEVVEKYRIVKNEHDMAMNNFNKLKKTINKRIDSIKKSYERDLEISRKKLAKTINPGELKALNVFLEDLDIEDYNKVDYDTQIKKLRSAREKFKRLIDDPNTDRAHKLQYKYLDDMMQYRIDFLNIEFKKPIETAKGRDYLVRVDNSWSPLGMVKKIWLAMKDSPGTSASLFLTLASNAAFAIYYFVSTSSNQSKKLVVDSAKSIIKATKILPSKNIEPSKTVKPPKKVEPSKTVKPSKKVEPSIKDKTGDVIAGGSILYTIISNIPSYALSFAEKLISFIDWTVQNFYKLILSGIIASITLYNIYGEQMSFPILAFWSFVLANAVVFATSLTRILPSYLTG